MDKKLVKLIKEQEKQNFPQKIREKLSKKKQAKLTGKVQKLSKKFAHMDYTKSAHTNLITKIKFFFCRMIQKSIHKSDPEHLDGKYWAEQGWLDGGKPWK